MQVVILAGGKGVRLRPLTYRRPKPMISIHGKPFLRYQLEFIRSFGLKDVLILVGYLGNQIKDYFGNGAKFGLNIRYSYEEKLKGTGGALKKAKDELREKFLLLNGDTYLPINYAELVNYFNRHDKTGVITVYNNPDKRLPNNITVGESNLVSGYNKKDSRRMTHIDAGVLVLRKKVLTLIPETPVCSLEEEIFPGLIKRKELLAFPTNRRFYDIGNFKELKVIEEVLR